MMATQATPLILVGPRFLDNRICRLMYVRATDEVWTEEWRGRWVRTTALVRHVLKAPTPKPAELKRQGVPVERGVWDRKGACA